VPKWGIRLAGVWLILFGVAQARLLAFHNFDVIMGILAIAAGVLIVLDR
jgi:hypothetical protein